MREELYSERQNIPGMSADHSFMQRPAHPSFGWVKPFVDKYKWIGKKMKEQKRSLKKIRYCQLCLKNECRWLSRVFVVTFRS